jgi:hypothetical protein
MKPGLRWPLLFLVGCPPYAAVEMCRARLSVQVRLAWAGMFAYALVEVAKACVDAI